MSIKIEYSCFGKMAKVALCLLCIISNGQSRKLAKFAQNGLLISNIFRVKMKKKKSQKEVLE